MKTAVVQDVMSRPVVTVAPETGYKAIVDLMAEYSFSGVPVVDSTGGVLGIVSETDLLRKVELGGGSPARHFGGRRRHLVRAKATATLAADLMTSPALVAEPDTAIVEAARLMETARVRRLPVVSRTGELTGIVTRGDLLRLYLRPDVDLRNDVVEDVLRRVLTLHPEDLTVSVADGVVTLSGLVRRHSAALLAAQLTGAVPGVVDVVDRLDYAEDDLTQDGLTPRRDELQQA